MKASKGPYTILPVLSLLLTATLWGMVWYPLRLLEQAGLHGLWTTLISYSAALLVGLGWLWSERGRWARYPLALPVMTAAAGWTNVAFVLAILDGMVVRVLLLFYLSPLWALLLGWLILGEKPRPGGWLVFALAVSGAMIMLWDPAVGLPWPRDHADWLAVSSGFAFSMSNVMVRRMDRLSVRLKAAASWLGVVLVALAGVLIAGLPVPQVSAATLGGAVALGWLGFVIMTLAVIYGVAHMPVHRSAVILLFELVVGAVSSLILTSEQVYPREWLGGSLILASAWLAAREQAVRGE